MIKAILFDMGGVVCKDLGKIKYTILSKLSRDKLDYGVVKKEIKPYENRFETGKISPSIFLQIVANSLIIDHNKIKKVWIDTTGKTNKEMIQVVKKLKTKGYKIGILSNTNKISADTHKKRGDYKLFSPVVLSYEVGYRKPEKKIFQITLKKLKVKPTECIFIDDKEDKLLSAKKLGIKTILFKSVTQVKRELNKLL